MVSTRSKTGAAKPKADPQIALNATFASHSLLSWAAGRSKKGKNGKVIKRKPQTAPMLALPLDILATIFAECHPEALLQLSRTSLDLNAFLSSKNSSSVWVAARKALAVTISAQDALLVGHWYGKSKVGTFELPPCPSYMSEPAYAALLYEEKCSFCHTGLARRLSGCLTARVCGKCTQEDFVSLKQLKAEWKEDADDRLYGIIPRNSDFRWGGRRKPRVNERSFHKATAQAIFDKALQFEMEQKFDMRAMNAFYKRGEDEMKEREDFMTAYRNHEEAKERLHIIERAKEERAVTARFERNKLAAIARFASEGVEVYGTDFEDCNPARVQLRGLTKDLDDEVWENKKETLVKLLEKTIENRVYLTEFYSADSIRFRGYVDPFRLSLPLSGAHANVAKSAKAQIPVVKVEEGAEDIASEELAPTDTGNGEGSSSSKQPTTRRSGRSSGKSEEKEAEKKQKKAKGKQKSKGKGKGKAKEEEVEEEPEVPVISARILLGDFLQLPSMQALRKQAEFFDGTPEERQKTLQEMKGDILQEIQVFFDGKRDELVAFLEAQRVTRLPTAYDKSRQLYETKIDSRFVSSPAAIFSCGACSGGRDRLGVDEIVSHACFAKYEGPHSFQATRARLREEGVNLSGVFTAPTVIKEQPKLAFSWEKSALARVMLAAIKRLGETPPTTVKGFLGQRVMFTCEDCTELYPTRKGQNAPDFLTIHVPRYPQYTNTGPSWEHTNVSCREPTTAERLSFLANSYYASDIPEVQYPPYPDLPDFSDMDSMDESLMMEEAFMEMFESEFY